MVQAMWSQQQRRGWGRRKRQSETIEDVHVCVRVRIGVGVKGLMLAGQTGHFTKTTTNGAWHSKFFPR